MRRVAGQCYQKTSSLTTNNFRFRDLDRAAKTALTFMQDMIRTRRKEIASGAPVQKDILSLMVQSAEDSDEPNVGMSDEELVSRLAIPVTSS